MELGRPRCDRELELLRGPAPRARKQSRLRSNTTALDQSRRGVNFRQNRRCCSARRWAHGWRVLGAALRWNLASTCSRTSFHLLHVADVLAWTIDDGPKFGPPLRTDTLWVRIM